jgi:hypothetical protein
MELRPIVYKKYIEPTYEVNDKGDLERTSFGSYEKEFTQKGFFHSFCTDAEAIIEAEDGVVLRIAPNMIKFTDRNLGNK